jgi:multisubunit Na+/H+ antiporter MnhE subunit
LAEDGRAPTWYLVATGLVAFGVLLGTWIALVGSADRQDDVAGLIVAAVGTAAGWVVTVRGRAVPRVHRADLILLVRLLPGLVTGAMAVYAATWKRVRRNGPPSGYRTVATDASGGGWAAARRSSVITYLQSFTPETILVDLDEDTGEATVHDFVGHE